ALSAGIESAKFLADNATNDGGATTTRFEIGGGGDLVLNGAWTEPPDPTCSDSTKNQDETDVDCGGDICDPCAEGLACSVNADCETVNCSGGTCGAALTACGSGDTASMQGYWKLDEAVAGPVDDAMGLHDGTNNNATINQDGQVGQAYTFNGTTAYVDTGNPFEMTSEVTIEAWVKMNSCPGTGNNPPIAGKQSLDGKGYTLFIDGSCNVYMLAYTTAGAGYAMRNAALPIGSWVHVVGTYKNGDASNLYINGVKDTDAPIGAGSGTIVPNSRNFIIGGSSINNQWFPGIIDEVAVYNTAFTGPAASCAANDPGGTIYDVCKHYIRSSAEDAYCPY
ncbi:MAG: LamG domain-containing protein, partial [Candidatus Pacebacteria bacterium]|nr:LamG domain-containing protein [Candidatus Paceibacterota bacterium]